MDHEGRVLLGFAVREHDGLVTRDQPSIGYHVIRFGLDGRADLSLSLPTHVGAMNGIYLSDTDQIIVRANDSIQFLQGDDGNLQKGMWKTLCTQCNVSQSPTRRTLILHSKNAEPPLSIVRFPSLSASQRCGKAPQSIKSPEDRIENYTASITDELAYFHNWEPGSGFFAYRWPLCDYEHRIEMPLKIGGSWRVLSDDAFVVFPYSKTGSQGLEVLSSRGELKFQATLLKHESPKTGWPPPQGSEQANRLAVNVLTIRGENRVLDLGGHVTFSRIAVYDIELKKELASIPVNPKHRYNFEFSLSPDGHRLAILEDDTVKVFRLDEVSRAETH